MSSRSLKPCTHPRCSPLPLWERDGISAFSGNARVRGIAPSHALILVDDADPLIRLFGAPSLARGEGRSSPTYPRPSSLHYTAPIAAQRRRARPMAQRQSGGRGSCSCSGKRKCWARPGQSLRATNPGTPRRLSSHIYLLRGGHRLGVRPSMTTALQAALPHARQTMLPNRALAYQAFFISRLTGWALGVTTPSELLILSGF